MEPRTIKEIVRRISSAFNQADPHLLIAIAIEIKDFGAEGINHFQSEDLKTRLWLAWRREWVKLRKFKANEAAQEAERDSRFPVENR